MGRNNIWILAVFVLIVGCSKNQITGRQVKEAIPVELNKEMEFFFCPVDNCEKILIEIINSSTRTIHCALFNIDLKNLTKLIAEKSDNIDVKLVVDNQNYGDIIGPRVKNDSSNYYMHNKFCIIDKNIVITGSFNPTFKEAYINNNNLLVIYSKYLAENYEDEFIELWNGNFGKGNKVKYPIIYLNNHEIENYFCPEDFCSQKIIKEINKAERNIYFMQYSFTSEAIADAILFNKKIDIKGLFEKMGSGNQYSQYKRLKDFGLDIRTDKNPYSMHHKVFIIDNITVITGSMNPTVNGDFRNDENILIIHDKNIAKKYLEEFEGLFN